MIKDAILVAVPRRGASCYGKNAKNTMRIFGIPTIFCIIFCIFAYPFVILSVFLGANLPVTTLFIVIITRGSHQINRSQNLQVLPPVAKLSVISYNVGIKTYIQNSRCQNRENGGIYMTFGYARVSTKTQARDGNSLEAQQAALTAAGAEKNLYRHLHRHEDRAPGI